MNKNPAVKIRPQGQVSSREHISEKHSPTPPLSNRVQDTSRFVFYRTIRRSPITLSLQINPETDINVRVSRPRLQDRREVLTATSTSGSPERLVGGRDSPFPWHLDALPLLLLSERMTIERLTLSAGGGCGLVPRFAANLLEYLPPDGDLGHRKAHALTLARGIDDPGAVRTRRIGREQEPSSHVFMTELSPFWNYDDL